MSTEPVRLLGSLLLLALLSASAEAAGPKRVLVIHSFARDSAPYNALSNVLRSELTQQLDQAVALQEVSLDAELGGEPKDEQLFVEYLVGRARVTPPDLVIAIANPAMLFCLRHRDRLFPDRPLLATGLDRRRLDTVKLGAFDQAVTITLDFPAIARTILDLRPDTDTLAIVVGASPLEQFWGDVIERELAPLGNRLRVLPAGVVSLGQMRQRVAALPPKSAALYYGFAVGADGALHENELALVAIRESSSVPVFGVYNDQLGRGIVGGPLVDFRTMGSVTAGLAVRMLQNPGVPGGVVALPTPPAVFDWRELRHWAIPESQLPPGSVVRFKGPSIWDAYRGYIVAAALAIVGQAVLIAMLLVQRKRRRNAELVVQRQRTELGRASRLATLGELSASIAHEVNQPLGAIAGNADAVELLLDADPPKLEDAKRVLQDLKRANERASGVVLRIRELLRKRDLAIEPYDLNEAASEVIRLLDTEAARRGVQVLSGFSSIPVVHGDRMHFQQVLLNLVMNGMDAMVDAPVGQRRISVRTALNDDGDVEIDVADSGHGIDAAVLPRLFDWFFTTKKDGMGLGLSLCRSIVQAHGGRIWAQNNPGGGATFRLALPVDAGRRAHRTPVLFSPKDSHA